MLAAEPGSHRIGSLDAANAVDLVGDDRLARAAPAQHDRPIALADGNGSGRRGDHIRVVDRLRRIGPEVDRLMAELTDPADDRLLERESGMVGGNGDAHSWSVRATQSSMLLARHRNKRSAPYVVGDMERPLTLDEFDGSMVRQLPRGPDGFVVSMYEAHHAEVYAFLVRSTRDPSAAEDLLQETFLRLTTEARAGRAPEQVRAWLFRVASNLAISRARRNATAGT